VVAVPDSTTSLYVTISAFSTFSDLMLTCSSMSLAVLGALGQSNTVTLADGVPSDPFNLNLGQFQSFKLDLSNLSGSVTCTVTAADGDADLYLRLDAEPSLIQRELFDCASETFTSNETCATSITSDTTSVYARVDAFAAFNNGITTCTTSTTALSPQSPTTEIPPPVPAPVGSTTPAPVSQTGGLSTAAPNIDGSRQDPDPTGESGGMALARYGSAVYGMLIGLAMLAVGLWD